MEPQHLRFGGGSAETFLNPLVALAMLIACVLILTSPRNKGITPFLLACFSIPMDQVVVVGGLHFTVLRILIIAGLIRRATLARSSSTGKFPGGFNGVDRMVVLWTVTWMITVPLQWMELGAFIQKAGDFLDALGGYLVIRFFIPDGQALLRTVKTLAVVCLIQGAFMVNEQISHVNLFGYLGGGWTGVVWREGRIRSMGVMGCISAGAFAGNLVPLFAWLWRQKKARMAAWSGLIGATAMVFTSSASTSQLALAASILALCLWPLRRKMTLIRRGFACVLIALHLIMHGPVWALIGRVDLTGSSSSYHREMLVDNCIRHFSDWWLMGYKDFNLWGWDMYDLCNQFVVQALMGGLVCLVAYIMIFTRLFGGLGTARKCVEGVRGQEWLLWCLGSSLFSIVVAHFGINYPAMMEMGLFTFWACISVATYEATRPPEMKAETVEADVLHELVEA